MHEPLTDQAFLEAVRLVAMHRVAEVVGKEIVDTGVGESMQIINDPLPTLIYFDLKMGSVCDRDCVACKSRNSLPCIPIIMSKTDGPWTIYGIMEKQGTPLFSMHRGIEAMSGSSVIRTFGLQFALHILEYAIYKIDNDVLPSWFFGGFTNTFELTQPKKEI
jgi:hypothetical protein